MWPQTKVFFTESRCWRVRKTRGVGEKSTASIHVGQLSLLRMWSVAPQLFLIPPIIWIIAQLYSATSMVKFLSFLLTEVLTEWLIKNAGDTQLGLCKHGTRVSHDDSWTCFESLVTISITVLNICSLLKLAVSSNGGRDSRFPMHGMMMPVTDQNGHLQE